MDTLTATRPALAARFELPAPGQPGRVDKATFNHLLPRCDRDARSFIEGCCHSRGLPDSICRNAGWCGFELATNCLRHVAWPAGRDTFGVSVRLVWPFLGVAFLVVQFTDPDRRLPAWGPVDPVAVSEADVHGLDEDVRCGGWGLSTVEASTDDLQFRRTRWGKRGLFRVAVPSGRDWRWQCT
jgi:hypothetical protein